MNRTSTLSRAVDWLLACIVASATALIPLLVSANAYDSFRLPKELAYRAEAILIIVCLATAFLLQRTSIIAALRFPRAVGVLIGTAALWILIVTAASTNKLLSVSALIYAATVFIVLTGTYVVVADRTIEWLLVPVAIAVVPNGILAILQAASIWDPFHRPESVTIRERTTALLGNPNDVGSYLALAVVLTAAGAVTTRTRSWWVVAAIAAAGVIASGTVTAIAALIGGLFVLAIIVSPRTAWISISVILIALLTLIVSTRPLRERALTVRDAVRRHDYPLLTSNRIYSIGAALLMFKDRPLIGIGPGAYKYNYLAYRKQFDELHPQWYLYTGAVQNFGEVHSDHVQILAEEGLPGYVLFLCALAMLGRLTFRSSGSSAGASTRSRFVQFVSMPLAVTLFILAIAAFPLELAASSQLLFHALAAALRWSASE